MSELSHRGLSEGVASATVPAALRATGNTPRYEKAEDVGVPIMRRGSSSCVISSLVHSPASELLMHSQSSSLQGLLASREPMGVLPSPVSGVGRRNSAIERGPPSPQAESSGVPEAEQQQYHVLRQETAFNTFGQPLASRSMCLAKGWRAAENGGAAGVEIETLTSTSSVSNGENAAPWQPQELHPSEAARTKLSASACGSAEQQAAAAAPEATQPKFGDDVTQTNAALRAEEESGPSAFTAAVRGGFERLMRLSKWQRRHAAVAAQDGALHQQRSLHGAAAAIERHCSSALVGADIAATQSALRFGDSPQGESASFGLPQTQANLVLLMELQRLRTELTQLHLQQQRQPSIVIQNHTAVAAKADGPVQQQQPERQGWMLHCISTFFASRLNRLLFLCGVGVSCFMLLEHWRHSWRMAQLRRRMDANLLLRGFQILEEALGFKR